MPLGRGGSKKPTSPDGPASRPEPLGEPGPDRTINSDPNPTMDVVASFLLERARHPSVDRADQQQLEDLLFAYLHEGFGAEPRKHA
jgi:hypothetical protein